MKRQAAPSFLLLSAAVCVLTLGHPQGEPDELQEHLAALTERVDQLEAEVKILRGLPPAKRTPQEKPGPAGPAGSKATPGDLAVLKLQLKETREELAQTLSYLRDQAWSAGILKKALAESEKEGFTYGINPDSRHSLLAGFNQFADTLQKPLPKPKVPLKQ